MIEEFTNAGEIIIALLEGKTVSNIMDKSWEVRIIDGKLISNKPYLPHFTNPSKWCVYD